MEWIKQGWSFFVRGGLVMWPLLLCSLVSLTIVLERWNFFRKEDSGRAFAKNFCDGLRRENWQETEKLAKETAGLQAKLGEKLLTAPVSVRGKESYVGTESQQVIDQFEKGMPYLSVIVTLAPILGLLGTVTGMMSSFEALGSRWENPLAVTSGVGEALITTIFGLIIAILTICFHTYFSQRVRVIAQELEQMDNTFLENEARLPERGADK